MSSYLMPTADWLVLGARMEISGRERCVVFASDSLTMAEFKAALGFDSTVFVSRAFTAEYEMACTMRGIKWVYSDTYAEAMAAMFADWQPKEPDRRALPTGRKELP